jgi:hypothetical protein
VGDALLTREKPPVDGLPAAQWNTSCRPQALRCTYTKPAIILGLVSHLPTGMMIAAADYNDLIPVAVSVKAALCESRLV